MCHECGDDDDVQFSSDFVDELQQLPPDEKEEVIADMQESLAYVIQKAEEDGILFSLITEWPRQKIAMYEAAMVIQKNVLGYDDNN
jgi:hypothetical protein